MRKLIVLFAMAAVVAACGGASPTPAASVDIEATVQARVNEELSSVQEPGPIQEIAGQGFPTPTTIPEPSEDSQSPPTPLDRIILLSGYGKDNVAFTKLEALAFTNGIPLSVYYKDDPEKFQEHLNQPDVAGVIYIPARLRASDLPALRSFIDGGGRALFLYSEHWVEQNESLRELFGVSVVEERLVELKNETFFYTDSMLPSFLKGKRIVATTDRNVLVMAYVATTNEIGEAGVLDSAASEQSRLVYFNTPLREIVFFPMVYINYPRSFAFFDDISMHVEDNEAAALALLEFLLGE